MRVRGAIAIVVLVAALVAGCGGGSTSTGTAKPRAAGHEGGIFIEGGPGPPPAGGGRARGRIAADRFVVEGEMVAGEEGWVRSGVGVFWTPDGGRTWRPITPAVPDVSQINGVYFAGARRGWALSEPGREGDVRPSMYMTSDGGRTWHHTRLRAYTVGIPAAHVSFSLVDGHELFALVKVEGDTASNFGPLLVSHDSGRHWRELPTPPPEAGRISFETPRRGWLAGGHPGPRLYRTVDGGLTWTEVDPGNPHASPPPEPPEGTREEPLEEEIQPGLGEIQEDIYTTPLIGPDGHGILGMLEATGDSPSPTSPTAPPSATPRTAAAPGPGYRSRGRRRDRRTTSSDQREPFHAAEEGVRDRVVDRAAEDTGGEEPQLLDPEAGIRAAAGAEHFVADRARW
jgi:hypothetical protein